ncbi:hypothetical protein HS088_TW20G00509 [Tripterygium wilfordii]|uniref:SHSP domain-containing protein n=1 Tax=Tripterygium wilfordii TaxID=458696 RepID=A0A7J7C7M9_TRIWF|nr:22.0 kDa heat shock protein-like [Tripterygium wilfordii]KAF5730139.1 hypothetical protein HS088_TW20G00509 [Tripterygium wilfordii]
MAYYQRREVFGERTRSHNAMVEEIVPSSAWTEDSEGHYLLLDLPGFNKEEVKFQIGNSGNITISGERLVKDNKFIVFEQTFKIPENSDTDEITGKFEDGMLHVTVPKQPTNKHEEEARSPNTDGVDQEENVEAKKVEKHNKEGQVDHDQNEQVKEQKAKEDDHYHKDGFPKEVGERSQEGNELLALAMEMLKKHKGIVSIVVLAFSFGFFVARLF